jgi:hypothetical protein
MVDVHYAKETISLYGKKDKFGNDMVSIFHLLWAWKVIIWFRNYLRKVRDLASKLRTNWNSAVSKVWGMIKSNAIVIQDTP